MGASKTKYLRSITPWGIAVKERLLLRKAAQAPPCTQDEIVEHLKGLGYDINKHAFSFLLRGVGVSRRSGEIAAVNELLRINIVPS